MKQPPSSNVTGSGTSKQKPRVHQVTWLYHLKLDNHTVRGIQMNLVFSCSVFWWLIKFVVWILRLKISIGWDGRLNDHSMWCDLQSTHIKVQTWTFFSQPGSMLKARLSSFLEKTHPKQVKKSRIWKALVHTFGKLLDQLHFFLKVFEIIYVF